MPHDPEIPLGSGGDEQENLETNETENTDEESDI